MDKSQKTLTFGHPGYIALCRPDGSILRQGRDRESRESRNRAHAHDRRRDATGRPSTISDATTTTNVSDVVVVDVVCLACFSAWNFDQRAECMNAFLKFPRLGYLLRRDKILSVGRISERP